MSIKKNMISNFLLSSSKFLFPLVTFPYITRTLSTESLGQVFYVDAFTQYFIIFSALGVPIYGIREVAKIKDKPEEYSKLVTELLILKSILAVFFSSIFILLYFYLPSLQNNLQLIKIGCISIIFSSFLMEWFYQGIEKYTFITTRTLIIKTISIVFILYLVKNDGDHVLYYLIMVGVGAINAIINFGYYLKKYHLKSTIKLEFKKHLKPLLILFSINIAISIYTILDTIILGLLTNPTEVSLYTVPLRLTKIFWTVVIGFGFVLIPTITKLYKENNLPDIQVLMRKSISVVLILTIPFCFFCLIYPEDILIIITGEKYQEAANALRILSFLPLFVGICNVYGSQFLLPIGEERIILKATIIGLIISVTTNLILIPFFKFNGAAIACFLAETAVFIYIAIKAKSRIKVGLDFQLISLIITSLLSSFVLISLIKSYHQSSYYLFWNAAIFGIIFLALQFLFFKNTFVNQVLKPIIKSRNG